MEAWYELKKMGRVHFFLALAYDPRRLHNSMAMPRVHDTLRVLRSVGCRAFSTLTMTLLRDIQNSAVTSSVSLPDLLRKCKVLAKRLKHQEFVNWVERELTGYPPDADVPAYRIKATSACGNFVGPFGNRGKGLPIPLSSLPDKLHEFASSHTFRGSVSALADLVHSAQTSNKDVLQAHWPPDFVNYVSGDIYRNMNMIDAWNIIPRSYLVGILDNVRTVILNFSLEIEEQDPDAGEPIPGRQPIPPEKIEHIMNMIFNGSVGAVQTGEQSRADIQQTSPRPPKILLKCLRSSATTGSHRSAIATEPLQGE